MLIQIFGPSIRKRTKNYEQIIKCESEYLLRMKKEIITNYTIKKGDKTIKITKSRKITYFY